MDKIKLIDICNPKQWKTIATSQLLDNGKFPVYGANGIIGYYNEFNHEDTTVLITCRGATCGNVHISIPKSYINGNAMALDNLNEKICLKEYLYYFLNYYDMTKIISGSAQPQITIQGLKKIYVKIYSIEEQKNIIKVLNKIKKIIDLKEKQVISLDNIIKSQFVEMFGDPILNEMKWNTDTINNVAPIQNYKGIFENKVWLLNLDMVESNSGRIINYIYEDIINIGNSTSTFNEENILYSKLRPYLNKVVIPNKKGYATAELVPLKPSKDKLNRFFLAYLLRTEEFVKYISGKVSGAKMPRVSMDIFKKFNLILPPLELQNKFADIVKQIDKQKFVLEKNIKYMKEFLDKNIID